MSLLLHQEDDEALLRVDGTRIDDDGRLQAPALSPRSEIPSRPETPVDNVSKKKISLKDYRSKDQSTVNTPERRPVDDIRRKAIKSHKEEVEAEKEDHKANAKAATKEETHRIVDKIRPSGNKETVRTPSATSTSQDPESQRPAKKRRLSAEKEAHAPKSIASAPKKKNETSEKRSIPTLLSPDLPTPERQTEKPAKSKALPELLLPNLPPGLEKILSAAPQRSEDVRSIMRGLGSPPRVSEKKGTEPIKASSPGRIRSDSQLSAKNAAPTLKVSSPSTKSASASGSKVATPLQNGRLASPRPREQRQSRTIVLRYGKKNARRVEMLIKLSVRPSKVTTALESRGSVSTALKTATKPEVSSSTERKRLTDITPEPPAKKPKTLTSAIDAASKPERPATPKPDIGAKSPKSRSTFSTPRREALKEPRSIAMQRGVSTDTVDARTPSQETVRTSTPLAVSQTSQPKTSPVPHSTPSRGEDVAAWTEIQTSVFKLGRTLKREGQRLAGEGRGKERESGVIQLVEALLCFMLNAGAQAQIRPNADAGWSTILPYLAMVWKQSHPYKHLYGLVSLLGAIVKQHLHHEHMRRLSKESLPLDDHNSIGSAPTPGSDGNTRNSEDPAEARKSFLKLRDEIVQNSKELRIAWLEGLRILNPDMLEDQYPKTWKMRSKDTSKRNPDRVKAKECGKALGFFIPVDVTTNVFEATNFALAFLHEWTLIEGVQWKSKIDLTGMLS